MATATTQTKIQILNPDVMKQYKPDQYYRDNASGAVFLKEGVTPIAGTTKTVKLPMTAQPATGQQTTQKGAPATNTTRTVAGAGTPTVKSATPTSPDIAAIRKERNEYVAQGHTYLGSMDQVNQAIREGKSVEQLGNAGYFIVKKATVFNPITGDRKAVRVGDPNAFAGGYVLETGTDNYEIRKKQAEEKRLNDEAKRINDMITGAKKADKTTRDKKIDYKSEIDKMLQEGDSTEEMYNELFNNKEMTDLRDKVVGLQSDLDKFDQQLDEVEGDIRKEVSGEASESYITAKATLRSEDILKAKRSVQRDYDTAVAQYQMKREEAQNLLTVRSKDADTRYNRLFQQLQLQIQQEGTAFNQAIALTNVAMQLPEGKSITLPNGQKVVGLKERDDLNVVQFTDANQNSYVIAVDKNTGKEVYRTYLGKAPKSGGSVDLTPYSTALKEEQAKSGLDFMNKVQSGQYGIATDENGKSFYYDIQKYNEAKSNEQKSDDWWNPFSWGNQTKQKDFFVGYAS